MNELSSPYNTDVLIIFLNNHIWLDVKIIKNCAFGSQLKRGQGYFGFEYKLASDFEHLDKINFFSEIDLIQGSA